MPIGCRSWLPSSVGQPSGAAGDEEESMARSAAPQHRNPAVPVPISGTSTGPETSAAAVNSADLLSGGRNCTVRSSRKHRHRKNEKVEDDRTLIGESRSSTMGTTNARSSHHSHHPKSSLFLVLLCVAALLCPADALMQHELNKFKLKEQVLEMFRHAYWSYMQYAYPADELMPLTCQGRVRGVTASRGDVDDCLGGFSLTLIDTLDTLVVMGEFDEFERAVRLLMADVSFDNDVVVSVFETNIRVVGGLVSAHLMALQLRNTQPSRMQWYTSELLVMAVDVADRLLPAFNTTSGLPYPRVNLRHGLTSALKAQHDTCTACGGTIILEFAALSRLTGDARYERAARKGMDSLWHARHRTSDLMGTVLNVHSGDWIRRDSGIGAGIDSYYEYCLKAFILLGDDSFLHRFNKHYDAVMKFVSKGPLFVDVHMHRPTVAARPFMDSLLAFWPGLQVLKGDLKPAIETHEMLYQVIRKHRFLPEAFTHDFQVHWGQYPLRPEFIESTYFLYKATKDPHYLQVAKDVLDSMNTHLRVPCGFAGVRDVRTMHHEDRMDSFVLAETFKYLYMMFADADDLIFDPDSFVFTTEAHMLPLSIAHIAQGTDYAPPASAKTSADQAFVRSSAAKPSAAVGQRWAETNSRSCPNARQQLNVELSAYARHLRHGLKDLVENTSRQFSKQQQQQGSCSAQTPGAQPGTPAVEPTITAREFDSSNAAHLRELRRMGIELSSTGGEGGGTIHLTHSAHTVSDDDRDDDDLLRLQEGAEDTRVRDWLSGSHYPHHETSADDDDDDEQSRQMRRAFEPRIMSFSQWLVGELNAGDVVALTAVIFGVWFATMLAVTVLALTCACAIKCVHQYVLYREAHRVKVGEEGEETGEGEEEKEEVSQVPPAVDDDDSADVAAAADAE